MGDRSMGGPIPQIVRCHEWLRLDDETHSYSDPRCWHFCRSNEQARKLTRSSAVVWRLRMAKLLALALALGFDSFLVCTALGTLDIGRTARRNLILLFALCDGIASLMGGIFSARFVGVANLWMGQLQVVAL